MTYNAKTNWELNEKVLNSDINKWEQGIADAVRQDGSTPFTAEQIGVDPTSAQGLTTLNKVNNLISAIDLSNLADYNLSNLTTTGKNVITNNVIPDYSLGVNKATRVWHTADVDCEVNMIIISSSAWGNAYLVVKDNNNVLIPDVAQEGLTGRLRQFSVPPSNILGISHAFIPKGWQYFIHVDWGSPIVKAIVYPMKGAS